MISKVFQSQCNHQTSKDWITSIKADLEYLGLNVNFAEIKGISKAKWKATVKQSVREMSLKYLNNLKQRHSKVNELKQTSIKMQPYLLPNELNASKEEIQLILRCRGTHLKTNLKGLYDTYECGVCLKEDESQEHIYKCTEILKLKEINDDKIPEYWKIMDGTTEGTTEEKFEIARIFKENMKIHERISNIK